MPNYLKAIDPDGNTIALICIERDDKIVLLQPVQVVHKPGYEVSILEVNSNDELRAKIGGQIVDVSDEDYNNTLFNTWGFDGSNIYRAGQSPETTAQGEGEKTDGDENANTGSDVQTPGGSQESDGQPEQPAQPETVADAVRTEGLGELPAGGEAGEQSKPLDDLGTGDAENGKPDTDDGDRVTGDVATSAEPAHDTASDPVDVVSAGEADDSNRGAGASGDVVENAA